MWKNLNNKSNKFSKDSSNEFVEGAFQLEDGVARRDFLKYMGASVAFAGLAGCNIRKPYQKIRPYSRKVEFNIPGESLFYATSFQIGEDVVGLLANTHEGRPTKIEGNPLHSASKGKSSLFHQASVLDLYDPDRVQSITNVGDSKTKNDLKDWFLKLTTHYSKDKGKGLSFLFDHQASPTFYHQIDQVAQKFPNATFYRFDPVNRDNVTFGLQELTGQFVCPRYNFDDADVVVSFGADFLGGPFDQLRHISGFSSRRDPDSSKEMNRLYVFESSFTATGAKADHRFPVKDQHLENVLYFLAKEICELREYSFSSIVTTLNFNLSEDFVDLKTIKIIANDLFMNSGKSILVAGDHMSKDVHKLVFLLNGILRNNFKTIKYNKLNFSKYSFNQKSSLDSIIELVDNLNKGNVESLIILGGDPVYTAPVDLNFDEARVKAEHCLYLADIFNKTALLSSWVVPKSHYLETWNDLYSQDGDHLIVQPVIKKMHDSFSATEILDFFTGSFQSDYSLLRKSLKKSIGSIDFDARWKQYLHDGIIRKFNSRSYPYVGNKSLLSIGGNISAGFELVFKPDSKIYDGRFVNNAWMQEMPDIVTKITWDNALLMSPIDAKSLKYKTGDVVKLTVKDSDIEVPVFVNAGQAKHSLILNIGYGQKLSGRIGSNIGVNANEVRFSDSFLSSTQVRLTKLKKTYEIATTQDHGNMEGRPHIRYSTKDFYSKHPNFAAEMEEVPYDKSLWKDRSYDEGYQWGMAIDLSKCVSCNACNVACQAENNVPIVGKEQVLSGREMHWIRTDRYYEGDENNPKMLDQPVFCMHCENAPCEQVCPVAATVHDDEGLNVMVYNRCIGTRYCSNNCPVKVRRFNFFDYHQRNPQASLKDRMHLFDYIKEPNKRTQQQFNPNVTVRMRGIMEKCTYCIQRIKSVSHRAKNESRDIVDGELQVACQQACPADSIIFGNINDPESIVSKVKKKQRNYELLAPLFLKARTTYLASIFNPNPELAYLDTYQTKKEDSHHGH